MVHRKLTMMARPASVREVRVNTTSEFANNESSPPSLRYPTPRPRRVHGFMNERAQSLRSFYSIRKSKSGLMSRLLAEIQHEMPEDHLIGLMKLVYRELCCSIAPHSSALHRLLSDDRATRQFSLLQKPAGSGQWLSHVDFLLTPLLLTSL